jgi:hypothetical protein
MIKLNFIGFFFELDSTKKFSQVANKITEKKNRKSNKIKIFLIKKIQRIRPFSKNIFFKIFILDVLK